MSLISYYFFSGRPCCTFITKVPLIHLAYSLFLTLNIAGTNPRCEIPFSKCLLLSELCTGLPAEVAELTTAETFPVSYGTEVTVTCGEVGVELRGDSVVTCEDGEGYTYGVTPKCNRVGESMFRCYSAKLQEIIEK